MLALFWISVLVMLMFYFSGYLEQRRNPNQDLELVVADGGSMDVVLKRNRAGHYLARGLINGMEVEFLVDTGATHVAIPGALAERLGLRGGVPGTSHTAGGIVRSYRVQLDSVQLGVIRRRQVSASVVPDMPGEGVLLGMSFLRDLEIVQSGTTMTLRLPGRG